MSLDRGAMSACIQTMSTDSESLPAYIAALSTRRKALQGDPGPCKPARIQRPPALNQSAGAVRPVLSAAIPAGRGEKGDNDPAG
jgi:hypothetical protein